MTEPLKIYNLPTPQVSDDYARRTQEAETQDRGAADITAAAHAATVRRMQPEIDASDQLFGTHIRTHLAHFAFMPGWDIIRSSSILEAPSLGTTEKREADIQKLLDVGGEGAAQIAAMIASTNEHNQAIVEIRSMQGATLKG